MRRSHSCSFTATTTRSVLGSLVVSPGTTLEGDVRSMRRAVYDDDVIRDAVTPLLLSSTREGTRLNIGATGWLQLCTSQSALPTATDGAVAMNRTFSPLREEKI